MSHADPNKILFVLPSGRVRARTHAAATRVLADATANLQRQLGRPPTANELAHHLGTDRPSILRAQRETQ